MKKKLSILKYVLLAAALCALVWWGRTHLAPVVPEESVSMPESEFAKNPELSPPKITGEGVTPEISKENIKAYLKTYKTPNTLYWNIKTTIYNGAASITNNARYYKKDGSELIEIYTANGGLQYSYSISGGNVKISNYLNGESFSTAASEQYSRSSLMRMPELSYFLNAPVKDITAARFELMDNRQILYVEYTSPSFSQTEKYWISLEYGVVLKSECYTAGHLTMAIQTSEISETLPKRYFKPRRSYRHSG
ncbi:MAG: hypothetical protein Q8865_00630 [Bacillota bacterium]|nr:hypothetical protein [Bacillota bacterium]